MKNPLHRSPHPHSPGRSSEPFWWALFGAGGVVAALFLPVLILVTGIAIPLGWIATPDYESIRGLLDNLVVRAGILAIVSLSAFHWAHRFRFTLYDGLQLKHLNAPVALVCYGCAIALSGLAAYTLFVP